MIPYYLFLDDIRKPSEVTWIKLPRLNWLIVRNYKDFVKMITDRGLPAAISFDHDLVDLHYVNGEISEKTGYDCAKWLIQFCMDNDFPFPEYYIHTMNPIGADNINGLIRNFKKFRS